MTVQELIEKLANYPSDARVTLWDPDTGWLLPILICDLPADSPDRECAFVAITGSYSDSIEGHAG